MSDSVDLPPNFETFDPGGNPKSGFPPIYRDTKHPLSNRPGHEPVDTLVIRVNPIDLPRHATKARFLADRAPKRPTMKWCEDIGIRKIQHDFVAFTRLEKDGANSDHDLHLVSWSSPEYMARHAPPGVVDKLNGVLDKILGSRDSRAPETMLPWEESLNAAGSRQATRNHLTTMVVEAPRNIYKPSANASSRQSPESAEVLRTFNKCIFHMGIVHQARLPPDEVAFQKSRFKWFNHPRVGCDENEGYFNQSQANFGPFLYNAREGLQASQGNSSIGHSDEKDDPSAWSFFLPLHDHGDDPDNDEGWMVNLEYGIMFPLKRLSGGAMNGQCLHLGVPCSSPNVEKSPWLTRLLVILYSHELPVNGRSAKQVGYTTSRTIAEVDPRVLAYPESLRSNEYNATFMRDLRASMESDESVVNYQLRLGCELLLSALLGNTDHEFDIAVNELVEKSRYRRRGDPNAEWASFQSWTDAPNIRDEDLAARRKHFDECDRKRQEAYLRLPRFCERLPTQVLLDASVVPVANAKGSKKRPRGNKGDSDSGNGGGGGVSSGTHYNDSLLDEPTPRRPRRRCSIYDSESRAIPNTMQLIIVDRSDLNPPSGALQDVLTQMHLSFTSPSPQRLRIARMLLLPLVEDHVTATDSVKSSKALSNVHLMLVHACAWFHLRETEALLIAQQHTIGDFGDPKAANRQWWDSNVPWELRLLKIVYEFLCLGKEDRKRRRAIRTSVGPGDVIDGASQDEHLTSSVVTLHKVCQGAKTGWDFQVQPWFRRSAIAIERTIDIIARWMGLHLQEDEQKRWHAWEPRGKLVTAILRSGKLGLLAQDEILSAFRFPHGRSDLDAFSVAELVQEIDCFWSRKKAAKALQTVDSNTAILRQSITVLDPLVKRAKETPLLDVSTILRDEHEAPDIDVASMQNMQENFAGFASHIIARFLQSTRPLLESGLTPTTVSQWITKADAKSVQPANGKHPIRRLGPDRAFVQEELARNPNADTLTVAFSTMVHAGITLNSEFMASPLRQFLFRDAEHFRSFSDTQTTDFMCSKRPFGGQFIGQRSCEHVDVFFAAAERWNSQLLSRQVVHNDNRIPFCAAYDFFIDEHLPAISEMTTWVLVCDLVAVGQVLMPSPVELWNCLAKSYKQMASKAMLRTLGILPNASHLAAKENSDAFETLYGEVRGRLGLDADRMLPDIIHFEHTLCKLKRFHSDHPETIAAWVSEAPAT